MLKLTGALLCVSACVAAGLNAYANEKKRLSALLSLSQSFSAMRAELSATLAPTPELLKAHAEGYAAVLLRNAQKGMERIGETELEQIWAEALELCPPLLREDEKRVVRALGAVLGRCTLETQLQALSDAAARLEERAEELRRGLPAARRLSLGLPAAFGLLTAILLS